MQNKPNLLEMPMNISSFITVDYENVHLLGRRKNKPNTNPIKPNSPARYAIRNTRYEIQTQSNPTCSELVEPISNGAYSPLAGSYLTIYNTTPEPFTNKPIGQLCK